jgi:UDP-3-O-[3-hydroxymyristoyl] N-acetylglucosamine deacetylase
MANDAITYDMSVVSVAGVGLLTGLPCRVSLTAGLSGSGLSLVWPDGVTIAATLDHVNATERGVTLQADATHQVAIVEHFLAACALGGVMDLQVTLAEGPELPILDGSAQPWLEVLSRMPLPQQPEGAIWSLSEAVRVDMPDSDIWLTATPADGFSLTYTVDFDHADLHAKTLHWCPANDPSAMALARAGTFGYVAELPVMQANGFALGVNADNTLGLTVTGGYTRPLRMPNEPVYHKMLDCLGDLMLTGINPLRCGMHITAFKAGHRSHIALARLLRDRLSRA